MAEQGEIAMEIVWIIVGKMLFVFVLLVLICLAALVIKRLMVRYDCLHTEGTAKPTKRKD